MDKKFSGGIALYFHHSAAAFFQKVARSLKMTLFGEQKQKPEMIH